MRTRIVRTPERGERDAAPGTDRRPAPAARIPAAERHALAIRQSLRWAEQAAREGDYERALSWLTMVERVEGRLPDGWSGRREAWVAGWAAQRTRPTSARPGRSARP